MAQDAAQVGDTSPVSAPVAGTPARPPSVPDTAATRGVWAALVAQPGSTAASLADAAGISRPTAAKALALLEKASLVTRTEGGREGSKRLPDQWQPVGTEDTGASDRESADAAEPASAEVPVVEAEVVSVPEQAEPEPSDSAEDTDPATVAQPVADAEPAGTAEEDEREATAAGEEPAPAVEDATDAASVRQRLRPGELRARVLEFMRARPREEFSPTAVARALEASAGAVSNALERLVGTGEAVRKADSPRRFSAAPKRR